MTSPLSDLYRALAQITSAIDAGDDSVMPAWCDVLEELGDPRAAGLRRVENYDRPFIGWVIAWWTDAVGDPSGNELPEEIHQRLRASAPAVGDHGHWIGYPTRSAAFLALAAALSEEQSVQSLLDAHAVSLCAGQEPSRPEKYPVAGGYVDASARRLTLNVSLTPRLLERPIRYVVAHYGIGDSCVPDGWMLIDEKGRRHDGLPEKYRPLVAAAVRQALAAKEQS